MLAVDLGASSGRVMAGSFDGEKISVEELHRFSNDPVTLGGTMYWDFLRLFHEIKQGLLGPPGCFQQLPPAGMEHLVQVGAYADIRILWHQFH